VLSFVVLVCISLIGVSGVIKYRLDRAELALSSPDVSFASGGEIYEKVLRALGYGGFAGSAARFIEKHDKNALDDMKRDLKAARDALVRIPEKTQAAVRHDIEGILNVYASILNKAEKSLEDSAASFSAADLTPALSALPLLDSRVQSALASARLKARNEYRLWGLALTLVAWISLILAAALAGGIYLTVNSRQTAPMRALAQSVQNLAKGDMESRIWGMERRDAIGELARAIDLARYHFSKLPDLSLMSEQGPVRIKFEGETRSLFQAMMRNITDEYERARAETLAYTQGLAAQREALTELSSRLNSLTAQLQQQEAEGHRELQKLAQELSSSARSITSVQDKMAAQMLKLIPFMQERAHNMAEVTHIAGTKMTHVLENLIRAEQDLRDKAKQSAETVEKFAGNTNQMGERIFAAINLMQASSKALSEVTESVKSRFNDAIDSLGRGEETMQQIIARVEERLGATAKAEENMAVFAARAESNLERMEGSVRNMSERHDQMSEQIVMATTRMEGVVSAFDSAQRSLNEAMQQVRRDGEILGDLLKALRENNEHLLSGIAQTSQTSHGVVRALSDKSLSLMQTLESKVLQMSRGAETRLDAIASSTEALNQQVHTAIAALTQTIGAMRDEHESFMSTRKRFGESVDELENHLKQQATSTIMRAEKWASESFARLSSLTENMESLMQRLNVLGQLTGTLGSVAAQIGQLMPVLTQSAADSGKTQSQAQEELFADMQRQMQAGLHETMACIEAMHDQLAKMMTQQKDQLELRLVVMDKKIKEALENGASDPQQIRIMNDIVAALAQINENVSKLDETVKSKTTI